MKNLLVGVYFFSFYDIMNLKIWDFDKHLPDVMISKTQSVFYRDLD